jgi:predicted RNA-binding protein YlxR (DUF448 family)
MREGSDPEESADGRERRDLASGVVMAEDRLIRFVLSPTLEVVPDLARRLPGRGLWVEARREAIDQAVKKGSFARAAKAPARPAPDLADQVERLLVRRSLDGLGLARRAGALTSGFEKVSDVLASGRAAWVIEASDGSPDGRGKILARARRSPSPPRICGAFSADELGLALGLGHAIHTAFLAGRLAERWGDALGRLAGFRPILPERWSDDVPDRVSGAGSPEDKGRRPGLGFAPIDGGRPSAGDE